MIGHKIFYLEEAIKANYKEDFKHLNEVISARASKGHYDTRIDYSATDRNYEMVMVFHDYLVQKNFQVYCGKIDKFPFISIHWR